MYMFYYTFPEMPKSLNIVIVNAKRFMTYEIIKRLETDKDFDLLEDLYHNVKKGERKKGNGIKFLPTALMRKNVIQMNLFIKNLNTSIRTR